MAIIADTSVWVDVERNRLSVDDLEAAFGEERIFLSPPTIAELEYGLMRAKSDAQRAVRANALAQFKLKTCLVIDKATGSIFGRIASQLDSKGHPSKHRVQDLWIASLALQHGLKLLTQNRRDFEDIPGLTILSPPPPRVGPRHRP